LWTNTNTNEKTYCVLSFVTNELIVAASVSMNFLMSQGKLISISKLQSIIFSLPNNSHKFSIFSRVLIITGVEWKITLARLFFASGKLYFGTAITPSLKYKTMLETLIINCSDTYGGAFGLGAGNSGKSTCENLSLSALVSAINSKIAVFMALMYSTCISET